MSSSAALLKRKNQAYLVYTEWGPDLLIPRDERLADQFPEVTADVRHAWMTEFDRVEAAIWQVAEAGGPRTSSFESFKRRMKQAFPFMNDEALSRAWTRTGYYAWHEGY